MQASSMAIAPSSPPDRTKSPIDTCSRGRASKRRSSNSLETAAEQDHAFASDDLADSSLGERRAARRHSEHRTAVRDTVERGGEHVGPEHHSSTAAGGRIVDAAMFVGREVADLDRVERPNTFAQRPPRQAYPQWPREHLGIEGQNGGAKQHCGTAAITIHWAPHGRSHSGLPNRRRRACGIDRSDLPRTLSSRHPRRGRR